MVGVNPGKLRQRIEFYSLVRTSDAAGGFESTEVLTFSTQAEVKASKSLSTIEAGQMVLINPYQVLIRYSVDHQPKLDMIVKYRAGRYLIKAIEPADELNRMVRLIIVRE